MIFSRGSCNERQRADRKIRERDTAGQERWRFIDSRKFTRPSIPSYLLVLLRHPPVPLVPASDPRRESSSWQHGPVICPFHGMEKKRLMLADEGRGDVLVSYCTFRREEECDNGYESPRNRQVSGKYLRSWFYERVRLIRECYTCVSWNASFFLLEKLFVSER